MMSLLQWHFLNVAFAYLKFSIWQQLLGNLQRFSTAALSLGLLTAVIKGCFGGPSHS